mmetsp:Transcript_9519/g.11127  ORF Transcript_9519/g.11127 Transcript_9519/m.11127 type:complete len:99 (+) Transcript_9519:386-682(+)
MAFPSREFGAQEFDSNEKIQEFAAGKNFPTEGVGVLLALGKVKGDDASEVWRYMKEQSGAKEPTWNFDGKFLVDKSGVISVPKGSVGKAISALMEDDE